MQLWCSTVIRFPVHAFPFLIELGITNKIFRMFKLFKDDDRTLVKVGFFFCSPASNMGLQKPSE